MKATKLLKILQEKINTCGDFEVKCDNYKVIDAGYSEKDKIFDILSTGGISNKNKKI